MPKKQRANPKAKPAKGAAAKPTKGAAAKGAAAKPAKGAAKPAKKPAAAQKKPAKAQAERPPAAHPPALLADERTRLRDSLVRAGTPEGAADEKIKQYMNWWALRHLQKYGTSKWDGPPNEGDEYIPVDYKYMLGDFDGSPFGISKALDSAWHAHILNTRDYHAFCNRHFSTYVHHDPTITGPALEDLLNITAYAFAAAIDEGAIERPSDAALETYWSGVLDPNDLEDAINDPEGDGAHCG
jgi:hypothetical protein